MNTLTRPCKVCSDKTAKYNCPQCNLPYCSLSCYKEHGARCTETFYRTQAVQELRDTKATTSDRQHMLKVLERLQQEPGSSPSGSDSEDSIGSEAAAPVLSKATLSRLRQQEEQTGTIDVSALRLSDQELEALGAAAAHAGLEGVVAPWQPWWMTEDAAELQLNERGQRLVQGLDSGSMSSVPALPEGPLPTLSSLTKAVPSPLLQWQLVDLLYTYCLVARLYNGDHVQESQEAIGVALEVSPSLTGSIPLQSSSQVILDCTAATLKPSVCGSDARIFSQALWHDTVLLLGIGRSACLCALADIHLLISQAHAALLDRKTRLPVQPGLKEPPSAAKEYAQGARRTHSDMPASDSANASRRARQAVQLASRKAWFLLVWVNEQPAQVFESVHAAMARDLASRTVDTQPSQKKLASTALIVESD